jgi:hypothetical protein
MVGILLNSCSPKENSNKSSNELGRGRVKSVDGEPSAQASARSDELQTPDRLDVKKETRESEVLAANHKSPGVAYFPAGSAQVASLAQKILAIPCRADPTDITKDLRKVLLRLEATGYGHIQYSRIASTQHRPGTLKPLAQNKLMRGLAR